MTKKCYKSVIRIPGIHFQAVQISKLFLYQYVHLFANISMDSAIEVIYSGSISISCTRHFYNMVLSSMQHGFIINVTLCLHPLFFTDDEYYYEYDDEYTQPKQPNARFGDHSAAYPYWFHEYFSFDGTSLPHTSWWEMGNYWGSRCNNLPML